VRACVAMRGVCVRVIVKRSQGQGTRPSNRCRSLKDGVEWVPPLWVGTSRCSSIACLTHAWRTCRSLFPDRDCVALVRPMNDEAKLANLDNVPRDQLRPEFVKVGAAHMQALESRQGLERRGRRRKAKEPPLWRSPLIPSVCSGLCCLPAVNPFVASPACPANGPFPCPRCVRRACSHWFALCSRAPRPSALGRAS
jgi:hypothetical protein